MNDVWRRFDRELHTTLLRGATAAFALIATADTEIAHAEVDRFVQIVRDEPRFGGIDGVVLDSLFRALAQALLDDPEPNRARALEIVAQTRNGDAEIVVAVAQKAIVADAHLVNVEELALEEVCEAMGVAAAGR